MMSEQNDDATDNDLFHLLLNTPGPSAAIASGSGSGSGSMSGSRSSFSASPGSASGQRSRPAMATAMSGLGHASRPRARRELPGPSSASGSGQGQRSRGEAEAKSTQTVEPFKKPKPQAVKKPMKAIKPRTFYHSVTLLPIPPEGLDEDSEAEEDEWVWTKSAWLIDDFGDLNEGEKEVMNLWNRHVMQECFVGVMGDRHTLLSCKKFVAKFGLKIIQNNLYRNFVLHLTNLFDFGLLDANGFTQVVQALQELMATVKEEENGILIKMRELRALEKHCYFCKRTLYSEEEMERHLRVHTKEEELLPCPEPRCKEGFPEQTDLDAHLKAHLKKRRERKEKKREFERELATGKEEERIRHCFVKLNKLNLMPVGPSC